MIKLSLLFFLISCSSVPHGQVEYYSGLMTIKSADNKKTLAKIKALMRRTVDPYGKKIYEEIIQQSPKGKSNETTISFELIQKNHFTIQDENRLIRGHAYFEGPDWQWSSWTVRFSQLDGSVIEGEVKKMATGLVALKKMSKPHGAILIIEETFHEIDLPTFKNLKKNKTK